MKKWTRWQDWVAMIVGLFAALSTMWTAQAGASAILMLVFGALLVVSGVWNLAKPEFMSMEWVQVALGALLFISPWIGAYASEAGAAWTSWICGGVALVAALLALRPHLKEHSHHKPIPSH